MSRRGLRRIQEADRRAARAKQERHDLTDSLTAFEAMAREAGVRLRSAEPYVASQVPPSLIAATSASKPGGVPVVVDVGSRRVVAVTGPAGDPREWMPSIAAAASLPLPAGQVTRIERTHMPAGLHAAAAIPPAGSLAVPPGNAITDAGGLTVQVSDALNAAEARHAAVAAVSAARRNGWEASLTNAIIPVLTAAAGWHAAAISLRAALLTVVTAATAAAAGVAIAVLPGRPAVPLVRVRPLPAPTAHAHHHLRARNVSRHLTAASEPVTTTPDVAPSGVPVPKPQGSATAERHTSARVSPSGSRSPQPTTSTSAPSPTPSASPSSSSDSLVATATADHPARPLA